MTGVQTCALPISAGIGVPELRFKKTKKLKDKQSGEQVLVDPMTKEIISKVAELDEDGTEKIERGKVVYKVNDHWFILNAKFVWKDAPVNRDS